MEGIVYVIKNPAFPNLVKIGKSDRDPNLRKEELQTTGVPKPFKVEYWALVDDPSSVEKKVHIKLQDLREDKNREFFNCSVPDAFGSIQSSSSPHIKYEEYFYDDISKQLDQWTEKKFQDLLDK